MGRTSIQECQMFDEHNDDTALVAATPKVETRPLVLLLPWVRETFPEYEWEPHRNVDALFGKLREDKAWVVWIRHTVVGDYSWTVYRNWSVKGSGRTGERT